MEQFDELDCRGVKTGNLVSRDEAHSTGTWHGAFHCLLVYERGGRGYTLFQKRSSRKKIAPGRFDVSVGGHYAAGEDAACAGPREIREELGLDVPFKELTGIGRRIFAYCFTPDVTEYEFQDVFLLQKQVSPGDLTLQAEEIDGVMEMEVDAGISFFSGQIAGTECSYYGRGSSVPLPHTVSRDQFVPCLDNYYLKLLLLARRYLRGERELLFI